MDKFKSILDFATLKHAGQKRKNSGADYITHPIKVAEIALEIAGNTVTEKEREMIYVIALLHDVRENSDADTEEITNCLKLTGKFTRDEIEIINSAITALTRESKEDSVIDYLYNIGIKKYARIVKLADLRHNLSDLKPGNLRDKYELCQNFFYENKSNFCVS